MQVIRKVGSAALLRLPRPVLDRAQRLAQRNSRTSTLLKKVSGSLIVGPQPIANGPARGLLIDIADSRPSYVLGTAEASAQAFIAAHLRPGDSFYDLGANVGYFTLVGAKLVGPTGSVRSFEPLPGNAQALRRNVELNHLDQVTVVEAAVSREHGEARFSTGPTGQDARLEDDGAIAVRTVSIDDEVAAGARPPSFAKIDVEGAELDALHGMAATLREHRPVLLCEIHDEPISLENHPVPALLRDLGYTDLRWLEEGVDGDDTFWAPHLVAIP